MATLRVIAKDQRQFDRFKKAMALYPPGDDGEQAIVYRLTSPMQLINSSKAFPAIVVLPNGFNSMWPHEVRTTKIFAKKYNWKLYSMTEAKLKKFEEGPNLLAESSGQALEELVEEGGD